MPQTSHQHAYPRQYVYKIKESSSADSPNSVISATASLKIRARFRFSHNSVKIKPLNAWHSIASHSKLWLMHAKVFKRESQTSNEHTVAVL